MTIRRENGDSVRFEVSAAIETNVEIRTLKAGGILPLILKRFS
ncbi:hypothetical protein [Brucella endophytica]|nr:hypothetical protein [Brucella endophytica]